MNGHNPAPILRKYNEALVGKSMQDYALFKYLKQFSSTFQAQNGRSFEFESKNLSHKRHSYMPSPFAGAVPTANDKSDDRFADADKGLMLGQYQVDKEFEGGTHEASVGEV